jgi:hypothetical protein
MTAELKAFPVFLSDIFLNDSIQPITLKLCTLLQYKLCDDTSGNLSCI